MDLSDDQKRMVAAAINSFGGGAHPLASAENVGYFDGGYVVGCVKAALRYSRKAKNAQLTAQAKALLAALGA